MKKSKFLFLLACVFAVFSLTACEFDLPDVPGLPDKIEIPEIEMPGFIKDIIGDDSADDDQINDDQKNDDNTNDDGNEDVPHTHSYTWTVKEQAKCDADGVEEGVCECGEKTTRPIASEGHKIVVDQAVEPSCTATGLTEGKHCSVCGYVEVEQEVLPESHEAVVDEAVEATCSTPGLTEGKHCALCEKVLVAQEVVEAGHTEEVLAAVEATCAASGLTEGKKCSVCGEVLVAQEEVPALGHTEEVLAAVEATCAAPGLTEGKKCNVCGEILVAQEEVAQLDHIPGAEASFTSAQTCTVCNEVLVPQVKTITVYYYNTEKWTKVDIYAWNGKNETIIGSWPGVATEVATELGEGWYSYTISDKDLAGLQILFHNKVLIQGSDGVYEGQQTNDIIVEEGKYFFYGKSENGYATKEEALEAYELEQAQPEPEGVKVYLKPNSNWLQSNARFAIYTWDGGDQWFDMKAVVINGTTYYEATLPTNVSNIIFCRMNPNAAANNWNNKWNQTSDLKVQTNGTNLYTVKDNTWDKGGGAWSTVVVE